MISTRTPLRVTLGGGGTDLESYYRHGGGFIFAMGLDKYIHIAAHRPAFHGDVVLHGPDPESCASAAELRHEIHVRQTVEAVALDAPGRIAPRDRQEPRDARHRAVKRGVKTRHLWQRRMAAAERLDQRDFARQMLGIKRGETMQLSEQRPRDPLRLGMFHAMDHAVTRGFD